MRTSWLTRWASHLLLLTSISTYVSASGDPVSVSRPSADIQAKHILLTSHTELGQFNVYLATAQAILERHANDEDQPIHLHFVHFEAARPIFDEWKQSLVRQGLPAKVVDGVHFHPLSVRSTRQVVDELGGYSVFYQHKPTLLDRLKTYPKLMWALSPWTPTEYRQIRDQLDEAVATIQPDLIVTEPIFWPALELLRDQPHREHILLSSQQLYMVNMILNPSLDVLVNVGGCGMDTPLPQRWWDKVNNVVSNLAMAYYTVGSSTIRKYFADLEAAGVRTARFNMASVPRKLAIGSSSLALEPGLTIRKNVIPCGPNSLRLARSAEDLAADELYQWVLRRPTVLVVLGSHFTFTNVTFPTMARALRTVLDARPDVQVLWKVKVPDDEVFAQFAEELQALEATGRFLHKPWLSVDIPTLLRSGKIITYVNHCGANSFGESVDAGVPQVHLPLWVDTYDCARRGEYLGISVYASRGTAPDFSAEKLAQAILDVAAPDASYQARARAFQRDDAQSGRYCAADRIVERLRGKSYVEVAEAFWAREDVQAEVQRSGATVLDFPLPEPEPETPQVSDERQAKEEL